MAVGDVVHPNGVDGAPVVLPAGWMNAVVEVDPVAEAVAAFISGEPLRDPTEVYGQHTMPPHTPAYWHDNPNETGIHPWWRILSKGASRCGNKFGFSEFWCDEIYADINRHGHVIDRRELSYVLHYLKCKPTWALLDEGLEEQFVHESVTMIKARTAYALYRLFRHFKQNPQINRNDCYLPHNHGLHWPTLVTGLIDSAPVRTWDFR
eukprot:gene37386-64251_t